MLDNDVEPLTERSLSGLLNLGGTILGTSREKPFKKRLSAASEDKPALMLKNIHDLGLTVSYVSAETELKRPQPNWPKQV